jgi:hypothetical protein
MAIFTKTEKLRNICYVMFSQTVGLRDTMSKGTFSYFSAASGILHEDLRMFYCCWRHIFALKASSCNTQYFYIVDSDTDHQYTQRTVAFPLQQCLRERATVLLYTYTPYHVLFSRLYSAFLIIIFRLNTFLDIVSNFPNEEIATVLPI